MIPVVDLRLKFGMAGTKYTERTCVIVTEVRLNGSRITMSAIVDEVSEVLSIAESQIEEPPSVGKNVDAEFPHGMGKVEKKSRHASRYRQSVDCERHADCGVIQDARHMDRERITFARSGRRGRWSLITPRSRRASATAGSGPLQERVASRPLYRIQSLVRMALSD